MDGEKYFTFVHPLIFDFFFFFVMRKQKQVNFISEDKNIKNLYNEDLTGWLKIKPMMTINSIWVMEIDKAVYCL